MVKTTSLVLPGARAISKHGHKAHNTMPARNPPTDPAGWCKRTFTPLACSGHHIEYATIQSTETQRRRQRRRRSRDALQWLLASAVDGASIHTSVDNADRTLRKRNILGPCERLGYSMVQLYYGWRPCGALSFACVVYTVYRCVWITLYIQPTKLAFLIVKFGWRIFYSVLCVSDMMRWLKLDFWVFGGWIISFVVLLV